MGSGPAEKRWADAAMGQAFDKTTFDLNNRITADFTATTGMISERKKVRPDPSEVLNQFRQYSECYRNPYLRQHYFA